MKDEPVHHLRAALGLIKNARDIASNLSLRRVIDDVSYAQLAVLAAHLSDAEQQIERVILSNFGALEPLKPGTPDPRD